ncbi:MAG: formyltransferase family protein [Actinomycetota bacterium]
MRVAIVSNGNAFSAMMARGLFEKTEIVGVLVVSVPPGRGSRVGRLLRLARRTGLRFAAYKTATLGIPVLRRVATGAPSTLAAQARRAGVPVMSVSSANGETARAFLAGLQPEVLLSISTPERLDATVLAIPTRAAINTHWAPLPRYAGIAPYFWVLRNGEEKTAITIHVMEPELDAGPILQQSEVAINPSESALGLQLKLARSTGEPLIEALLAIDSEKAEGKPQEGSAREYFSWPSAADVRAARERGHPLVRGSDLSALWRESG